MNPADQNNNPAPVQTPTSEPVQPVASDPLQAQQAAPAVAEQPSVVTSEPVESVVETAPVEQPAVVEAPQVEQPPVPQPVEVPVTPLPVNEAPVAETAPEANVQDPIAAAAPVAVPHKSNKLTLIALAVVVGLILIGVGIWAALTLF